MSHWPFPAVAPLHWFKDPLEEAPVSNNQWEDWNKQVIQEFRSSGGRVAQFGDNPVLLLTTKGAKSGTVRTTPLVYLPDGERMAIFASKGGAPTNPGWFYNLKEHKDATVEVGTEKFDVNAEVAGPEERDRLYASQTAKMPQFGDYQKGTSRRIPVVILTRKR
jgi:deazaflavin-dependent oxidoreductase (nitroreductase family)